jgi:hypothetical protein
MPEPTTCPSCEGSGRIVTAGLGPFALEMRVLHINGNDRAAVQREGPKCKTCEGTGTVDRELPESPGFTCLGCGATGVGELWPGDDWRKPFHWYSRTRDGVEQVVCSRECMSKAAGAPTAVLPW